MYDFWIFGLKQAWACVFGGILLFFILVTGFYYPLESLSRYDFLFLVAVCTQVCLLLFKLETFEEAKIIFLFHLVGTCMEIFKTSEGIGSWSYPEENIMRIMGVPLFSGFMYAAVGSYLARVWRIFEFKFIGYPAIWMTSLLGVLVYINFFSHHFLPDIRYVLFVFLFYLYFRTHIYYKVTDTYYKMPLLLGFLLVTLFIWLAENVGTFSSAWFYPEQLEGWRIVSYEKIGSWYLLMFISFVMITWIRSPKSVKVETNVKR